MQNLWGYYCYDALHFHTVSLKKLTFLKHYFGEGHKNEYSAYDFDNVDNSG